MADLTFLGCDHDAYCASVERHVHEFEERTGHRVRVRLLSSDEYFTNELDRYLGGDAPADVFMSGPVLVWKHHGDGYVEPLDPYLERCSSGFNPDDFLGRLLRSNRWSGRFGDPVGSGPLLEIPVNCEAYNLAYVPEILERAQVDVPSTWAQYFDTARIIAQRAAPARGFAQRGTDAWHTVYTGFASQLWACGGRDFDLDGRCAIAAPSAVRATSDFLDALRVAGPLDWPAQHWYELAQDFAAGRYGLIVDSDHYVAYYEAPGAPFKGRIAYRLPPAGPGGAIRSNLWSWSIALNSRSTQKDDAWELIEWAAGPDFLLRAAFEGNMNPTRRSTWEDGRFIEAAAAWGDFAVVARKLIEEVADVLVTPSTQYLDVARRWTRALLNSYADAASLESNLLDAATDIDRLMSRDA